MRYSTPLFIVLALSFCPIAFADNPSQNQSAHLDDLDLITPEVLMRGLAVQGLNWTIPNYTPAEEAKILTLYAHLARLGLKAL